MTKLHVPRNPRPHSWWRRLFGYKAIYCIDKVEAHPSGGFTIIESHWEWRRTR